jgi:hypothetical protein
MCRSLFGGRQGYAQLILQRDQPICLEADSEEVTRQGKVADLNSPKEKSGFPCSLCPDIFYPRNNLYYHYAFVHFKEELISRYTAKRCPLCNKKLKDEFALVSHMGVTHEIVEDYLDPEARVPKGKRVEKKESHLPHLTTKRISCSQCSETFDSRYYIYYHYASVHFRQEICRRYQKGQKCPLCHKRLRDEPGILSHMGVTHDIVEDYLDKEFHIARSKKIEKKGPLNSEITNAASSSDKHDVGSETARKRDETSLNENESVMQLTTADQGGMDKIEMASCKESAVAKLSVKKRDFHCSRCPDDFWSRNHLYGHYARVHFKQEITSKYQIGDLCPFCGKILKTETFILSHMGVAHDLVDEYLDAEFRIARCKVAEKVPHCFDMSSKAGSRDTFDIAVENKESTLTDSLDKDKMLSVSKGSLAVSCNKEEVLATVGDMNSVLTAEQEDKYNRLYASKDRDSVPANVKDEKSFLDVTDEDLLGEDTDDEDSMEVLHATEGTALSSYCNSEFGSSGGSTPERRDSYNNGGTPSATSFVIEETWSIPEPDGIHVDIPEDSFQIVSQDDDNSDIVPVVQISDRTDDSYVHYQGADPLSGRSEANSLEGPVNNRDILEDLSQPQESLSPKELYNSEGCPITEASTSRQGPWASSSGSSPCFPVATGVEDTPAANMEIKMETGGRMPLATSDVKSLITRIFEDSDEENNDDEYGDM